MSSLASLSFNLVTTIASVTSLKLAFFQISQSGIRTDCLLPERDANCTRIVHEVVLIYIHPIANRHFEFPTMLSIFLFIITTLRFLIIVLYLVYKETLFKTMIVHFILLLLAEENLIKQSQTSSLSNESALS